MNQASYPFKKFKRELLFEFESVSDTKTIKKVIAYELVDESQMIFNLSLVDKDENGSVSDMVVSNNQDMGKVLATVIQTFPTFFAEFEDSRIYFSGSTPVRTRLYRIVIAKFHQNFEREYSIFGFINQIAEPFQKGRNYEAFLISKK